MKKKYKKIFKFLRTKPLPTNTSEILAIERTKLANERTLLSYIRSSLYLLIGGIGILQLKDFASIKWVGYASLGVCVVFLAVGFSRYIVLTRRIYKWQRILFVDYVPDNIVKQVDRPQEAENEDSVSSTSTTNNI